MQSVSSAAQYQVKREKNHQNIFFQQNYKTHPLQRLSSLGGPVSLPAWSTTVDAAPTPEEEEEAEAERGAGRGALLNR